MFCPKCGVKIRHSSESTTAPVTRPSAAPGLPNFQAFKSKKESERRSFFSSGKGKGQEREKVEEEMVAISFVVMKDVDTVKRGETLSLKVPSTATTKHIIDVALKKLASFNQRFDQNERYTLIFKDGSEATHIPGTNQEEVFTLKRYKEESGFGYARITLYLLPRPIPRSSGGMLTNSEQKR